MAKKPSIVLGISVGHGNSSAAIVVDGCLVAAAEEERFTRIKHCALFPSRAIAYCLSHANLNPTDIRVVAVGGSSKGLWRKKLGLKLRHPQLFGANSTSLENAFPKSVIRSHLKKCGIKSVRLTPVDHHLAHMLSARFLAGTNDVALLSLDGVGDLVTTAMAKPTEGGVEILKRIYFPHSLGYFYAALTQYLGFPNFGDDAKLMHLAGYGQPRFVSALGKLIKETEGFGFELNPEAFPIEKCATSFYVDKSQPKYRPFYSANLLTQVIGIPPRKPTDHLTKAHWDLAKSVQVRFEEIANHLIKHLYETVGGSILALSGGCAHNSLWIGNIPKFTAYKEVVVAPAAHDAGLAIGAALSVVGCEVEPEGGHWALMGPSEAPTPETSETFPFPTKEQTFTSEKSLITWLVQELSQQKIIGLFRGRMEFGSQTLGSRSIIADPRIAKIRDRLNDRSRHREFFRPLGASILWDHQGDWFKDSFLSLSMEATFQVREEMLGKIPGVVHADHTCRIHSVVKKIQPFLWNLLEAFRKQTGIPMLLNTSLSDTNPIACTEKDAVQCFASSEIDHLVIGNRVISRVSQSAAMTA